MSVYFVLDYKILQQRTSMVRESLHSACQVSIFHLVVPQPSSSRW